MGPSVKLSVLAFAAGAILGLVPLRCALAAPGNAIWDAVYSSQPASDGDSVRGLAIDEKGYLALTGSSAGRDGSHSCLTVKYGPYGTLEWAREFNPTWYDVGRAVAFDAAGNIYVAGAGYNLENPRDSYSRSYYTDYHLIKYGPDGEPLMEAAASGFQKNNEPSGVAVGRDGSIYVTGTARNAPDTYQLFYTVKFDQAGAIQWEKVDDWGADSYSTGITLGPDGNVIVSGWYRDPASDNLNIRVLRYASSSGKTLMDVVYNNEFDNEKAWGVAVDTAGNIMVAGETSADDGVTLTIKFAPDGRLLWANRYGGSEFRNHANAVTADRSGNVYVAGKTVKDAQSGDWLLLVYNTDGKLIFDKAYPMGGDAGAEGVVVDVYGNVVITGNNFVTDQPPFIRTLRLEGFGQTQGSAGLKFKLGAAGFDFRKDIKLSSLPKLMISLSHWRMIRN